MKASSIGMILLCLGFPATGAPFSTIEVAEWLAVSSDLNEVLDAIVSDQTLNARVEASYKSNSGLSSFEDFATKYRENCGNPMGVYAREHNMTSEASCVWSFLRTASQDSAFAHGLPFDQDVFKDCGKWLTAKGVADNFFIIGMWAIYENKPDIISKLGTIDCGI